MVQQLHNTSTEKMGSGLPLEITVVSVEGPGVKSRMIDV